MLQQARQRADVFVRDVCPTTKTIVTTPRRASTSTSNPTDTKNTPVPMDVSQMNSNFAKSETEEQESDSYQYEQDQDGDGDELFAVKGKGKSGFKGTCFKCGMRGHNADRCWQKGKGKGGKGDWEKGKGGSKGKWSNPSHSWHNSWYHSSWHGKAYGLEVDPWAVVELVPYLSAVSLKPNCEEFSEPKHVRKGHCTNTSQLENSGTFAHENRFALLASDDDEESLGDRDVAKPVTKIRSRSWKIGRERDGGFSCRDERVDECMDPEIKVSCHRKLHASQSNANKVSYLAKSEVDSKGEHDHGLWICRVCGPGNNCKEHPIDGD